MKQRQPGRRKRPAAKKWTRGRRGWYPAVSFVIIVLAVVLAMSVFFKVSKITVVGNSAYTAQEIIDASGIEEGDNLFFVNRIAAGSRIIAKLPYIQSATVTPGLPNRVTITVSESQAIAYIPLEKDNWTIDSTGKILGKAEGTAAAKLIRVDGITLYHPTVGEIASTEAEDAAKVTYLADILDQIQSRKIMDYVTDIDMSTVANPSFDYLGRFTVKLGSDENIEYKFGMLLSAVSQLKDGDYGTIDLSIDKQAHFSPN
jgi:cell division protein FtsQ